MSDKSRSSIRSTMSRNTYELQRADSICQPPEVQLLEYVRTNEVHKIKNIVRENPALLAKIYGHPYDKPILYIACFEFSEDILSSTIQTLIDLGADLYYSNEADEYKEALHFATLGGNPVVLERIIKNLDKDKINSTSVGSTALYLLVKQEDNHTKSFEKCLKLLLAANINVNKANIKNYTPILWAAYKGYKNVVQIILDCSKTPVDIDTHKIRGKSARTLIEASGLYEGSLPEPATNNNENESEILFRYIKEGRENDFVNYPGIENHVDDEQDEGTLLQQACKRNLKKIVDHLVLNDVDVNKRTSKNHEYPLEIAATYGYYTIFSVLLPRYTRIPDNVLALLLKNDEYTSGEVNHKECLKLLLNERPDVPVNIPDKTTNTPLHFSARYGSPDVTLSLLRSGASLANRNKFGYLPVEDIQPDTLEEHLDSCITVEPKDKFDKRDTVIVFNYKSLVPSKLRVGNIVDEKHEDLEAADLLLQQQQVFVPETDVVDLMSKTPDFRHLLAHPLISSFIYMKWQRISWFFYSNLIFYSIFCISLILHIFLSYTTGILKDFSSTLNWLLYAIFVCAYFLLLLREVLQVLLSPKTYFLHLENWLEILLIVLVSLLIFDQGPESEIDKRQLSSVAILLAALEMMLLMGQHPQMSTNIVMLRTVSLNFFKFLLWYAILILAFALSFYMLFNKDNTEEATHNKNITEQAKEHDDDQDFFVEPSLAMIKTIVMLTGEFDAGSINFKPLLNRFIFMLFVLTIAIILFNLLNGLAVSDTQMIKNDAEIIGYAERINHIKYIESMMLGNSSFTSFCGLLKGMCCCLTANRLNYLIPKSLARNVCLFPDFLQSYELRAYINQGGKVAMKNGDTNCWKACGGYHLEKKTVKRVKKLIHEKKNRSQKEEQMYNMLLEILRSDSESLKKFRDKLFLK